MFVIAFDFGITLLGQPSSYWHDARTANEGNPVFAWFMVRGVTLYLAFIVIYSIRPVGDLLGGHAEIR